MLAIALSRIGAPVEPCGTAVRHLSVFDDGRLEERIGDVFLILSEHAQRERRAVMKMFAAVRVCL